MKVTEKLAVLQGLSEKELRRSVLIDLFDAHRDRLLDYGGHRLAGGFTVTEEEVEVLIQGVQEYAAAHYSHLPARPTEPTADALLPLAEFDDGLKVMAPFGEGNPMPTFVSEPTRVARHQGTFTTEVRPELVLHKGRPDLEVSDGQVRLLYSMDDEGMLSVLGSKPA